MKSQKLLWHVVVNPDNMVCAVYGSALRQDALKLQESLVGCRVIAVKAYKHPSVGNFLEGGQI